MSEHDEQVLFFDYVRIKAKQNPIYENIIAIPNGGFRFKRTAIKLKREGASRGVLDTGIFIARGIYHGMFIEFKIKPNKLSPDQIAWKKRLEAQGYYCFVAWSGQEAIKELEAYLRLKIEYIKRNL